MADPIERRTTERGLQDVGRALTLAVDREIETSLRSLEALAASPQLDTGDVRSFYDHVQRVVPWQPRWRAVLLADGHGPEANGVSDAEKVALWRDALAWLRADLERWKAAPRLAGLKAVNHADTHDDLLAVRDPARRDRLPADERADWAAFWAEVKAFRERVNQRPEKQQ